MDGVTVKIITWNMGNSYNNINDWVTEFKKWDIIKPDVDILFITFQEAPSSIDSIKKGLRDKIGLGYRMYHEKHGSVLPKIEFYVHGLLFIKNDLEVNELKIPKGSHGAVDSICTNKPWFGIKVCTKPSLGIGIVVSKNNKQYKLIFVGSHLPVNPKDTENNNFGYQDRIEAIKTIRDEVINDISKAIGGHDNVFWAGDMNFRIGEDGKEQLDMLLQNNDIPGFQEYKRIDEKFKKTCRYKEYDDVSDYTEFINNRISDAGFDAKRLPSYCDRIIYSGNNFVPIDYYSWPNKVDNYPKSVAFSDHLAVILEGHIQIRPGVVQLGGSSDYYRYKYYKYKAKYIRLRHNMVSSNRTN